MEAPGAYRAEGVKVQKTRWGRARAALGAAFLAVSPLVALQAATVAPVGAAGTITLSENAPSSILYGTTAGITLTATNPSGNPPQYNLSLRDVLPAGVSYVAGSTTPAALGDPTVLANAPSAGETTLIWSNVADLQPGSSYAVGFQLRPVTGAQAATDNLLPGNTFSDDASAYVNSDPRFVPHFDPVTGVPVGSSYTGSANAPPPSILISPIGVTKNVPAPNGQFLRGVHDQARVYTLTVKNNLINPTDSITVDDWLPAAAEFLGCGAVDQTTNAIGTNPGFTNEYPGAPHLGQGLSSPPNCLTPTLVSTETDTPPGQPSDVYTHLQWTIGNLAPGATATIEFYAGITMRANSLSWAGSVPNTTGGQTANLDNNQGPETTQGETITNTAQVAGNYQGPLGGGATNPVSSVGTNTTEAADLAIEKSVHPTGFQAGQQVTYSLDFQTGEYRYAGTSGQGAVITDIVPNGVCPIDNLTNYDAHSDPQCAPVPGAGPTLTDNLTSTTTPLPYTSVTENADGTFTLTWDLAPLPPNSNETINFLAVDRSFYQSNGADTTPTLAGDTYVNSATFSAGTDATCVLGGNADPVPDPTCTSGGAPIYSGETAAETGIANATNASTASQNTPEPTVAKRIALPPPAGQAVDCSTATYISTDTNPPPTYQKGDEVCFQLEVDFPPGVQTKNPVVTDFLPPNSTYVNGSAVVLPGNTVTQSLDTSNAGSGVLTWTLGDLNADGNYYAGPGQVFLVDLAVTPTADPSVGNTFDLTGNLMKFTAVNTAGQSLSERDQAEYDLSWPLLGLVKGVEQVVRGATTVAGPFGFGSNVDNVQVEDGDQVTFRVDLTNTGFEPAQNVQVEDNLPAQLQCATDVSAISNGGACNGAGQILWPASAGISVPAATGPSTPGELSLTYVVTIPATVAAGESLPDHAGVASYQGTNDQGGTNTYIPANNIDPANGPSSWNTSPADDTSAVQTAGATLTKSAAPLVTPQGSGGPIATIGEPILYTLTATVPAGTNLYNATLSDPLGALPGASLVEIPGSATATLDGSALPGNFTLTETNNTVTLQFPATFNAPVGSPQTIVVTFLATVNNVAGNVAGANLTNTGTLAFQDSQSNPENVTASATVGIVEPDISMTKTDPNSGTGTPYAPGSTVPYTLTVSNAANASTAYGLSVTDVLPVGVVPVAGTISNGGVANLSGGQYTITWNLGSSFTIAPGGSQQLTYSATLPSQPVGSSTFVNNASAAVASLDTSLYPGARTAGTGYAATAQDTTHVVGTTITKSANPSSVIVGQDTTYTATVTIPANLSFPTLTAIDYLPDGMVFDSYGTATCTLAGGGSCGADVVDTPLETPTVNPGNGQTELAWFIGDVQPAAVARTVTLTYTAYPATHYTVKNGGGAVKPGDVLRNMVGTYWSDSAGCEPTGLPPGCTYTHTSAQAVAPVTVVAPTLSVQKVSSNPSPTPGVPYTYTVTVTNTSALPAYDATVNDPINGLLQAPTNMVVSQGSAAYSSGKIVWNLSGQLAAGNSATLTFQEELGPSGSITNNKSIPNTATVASFYGVPIATVNANPGRYDTYGPVSGSTSVTAVFPNLSVTKSTPSGSTAVMSSPFTWQFVVSDTTAAPLSATSAADTLPAFWTYDAGSTTIILANGTQVTGAAADPTVNTVGNTETLTWSSLGALANGQTITVTYQATPNPGAAFGASPNVNSVTVSGQDATGASGNASGPYQAGPATASAFINAADLAITKTVATPGGLVAGAANDQYNLAVVNNGPSAAQGPITVTDNAPPGTSFTGASGSGWQCSLGSGGTSVTCTLPGPLASGVSAPALTVSIDIPSSYALPSLSSPSVTNTATVSGPTYDPNMANNTSTITSPVTLQADLSITKTHSGSFTAGSTGAYQLTVTNNGPSDEPIPGGSFPPVTVVDTLPAGMTFVSATTSPDWTCSALGQTVTCKRTGASMPAGHSSLITLNVAIAANVANNTTLTNTATVTGNIPDPNPNNNTASDPTNIVTSADLSIVKTHDPADTFVPGTDVTYTLAVANAGPSDAVTPSVTDTLPSVAGVPTETFVSASGTGWSCGAVGQLVTCNATANLPAGTAANPITLIVQVAPGFTGSSIDNTATVGSTTSDPNPANNSFTDLQNAGSASADLSIVKSHVGDFTAGTQGTYTLAVANNGPSDAVGPVTVTDDLPPGMSFVSGTGAGWSCGAVGQAVTCTLAAGLATGGNTSISLVVNVASSTPQGVLTNTASVQSPTADPDQLNNTSNDQTTVQTSADLGIDKTHSGLFTPGTQGSYTLTVTNGGPSDAAGPVTVTDELPGPESFVSGTSSDPWSCSAVGQLVTCTLAGGLAANGSSTIDLTVAVDPGYVGGPISNTATVSSPTTDPNPSNDSHTDTTGAITPEADLSIVKSHNGSFVSGSPATYTLSVTNSGQSDNAGPIIVTDTLPPGETYVSASGGGWSCNPAPAATVTCTQATGLTTGTSASPITLDVTIDSGLPPQIIYNTASVQSGSTNDPNSANNSSTDAALVGALADLSITKKGNGDFIPGQNGTYTINVTNNGPSSAANPMVIDTLPTGLSYVSASGTGWQCTYVGSTNTVTCLQAAPLLAGASTQPLTLTVGVSAAAYPSVTNTASVSSTTGDPDLTNNSSAYTSTVDALDDLTITKTHVGNPVAGQDLTYQLAVSNNGPTPDPGPVKVVDQLPSSLTYVSAMGPGWQCSASGQTVTCLWSVPFPVGVTSTISLVVLPGAAAVPSVTNTATVSGAANDHTPSNNAASDTATTAPGAKLTLTKQLETPELVPGGSATYIITLANAGPSPATGLVITDDVPSGLVPTSASGTGWQCTIAGQTVTCDNPGPLAAGSSSQVTLVAHVTATGGTITNGATVASTTSVLTGSSTTASTPPVGIGGTGGSGGSSGSSGTSGGELAFTGFALWPTLGVGTGLLGLGGILLLLGRRRRPGPAGASRLA